MQDWKILVAIFLSGLWGCTHGLIASIDEDMGGLDTAVDTALDTEADTEADTTVETDQPSDPGEDTSYETGGCGDGYITPPEVCDDGNNDAGDGCTSNCSFVEDNYACPFPGDPCESLLDCGDAKIGGVETCDDNNEVSKDGCSADCQVEAGWICPNVGARCVAAACGDGILAGSEDCEDGNTPPADGDGCSSICKLEDGFACDTAGEPCHETVCNDGKKEGSEPCDDGNLVVGDGCTPFCEVEPDCSAGACSSACGDGIILPGDAEECDDGNTQNGDGCSAGCLEELGFGCTLIQGQLPDVLEVPITYRDFIADPVSSTSAVQHLDFENMGGGLIQGLVDANLGPNGKPVFVGTPGTSINSTTTFSQWYTDVNDTDGTYEPAVDINVTKVETLSLDRDTADDSYKFVSNAFFPWDNDPNSWIGLGLEELLVGRDASSGNHNFGFTSEIRYWFEYQGGEKLDFSGDDDVWVFANGQLVVDIGGVHASTSGTVTLDTTLGLDTDTGLGMEIGKIYEIVLFHAERHTSHSNYELTLTGFTAAESSCVTECGDGIVAGDEYCDLGTGGNNGGYGECTPDCLGRGPFCGDGDLDTDHEECDDGFNLTNHTFEDTPGCAAGCVLGAYCGDSDVNGSFGEQCDDGILAGGYNECGVGCLIDRYCGDGQTDTDHGEQCDDGNQISGDGCTKDCLDQVIL